MKRFFVLQNIETNQYFGKYRIDEYWTEDIEDANKFEDKEKLDLDEFAIEFMSGSTVKIVELIEFK